MAVVVLAAAATLEGFKTMSLRWPAFQVTRLSLLGVAAWLWSGPHRPLVRSREIHQEAAPGGGAVHGQPPAAAKLAPSPSACCWGEHDRLETDPLHHHEGELHPHHRQLLRRGDQAGACGPGAQASPVCWGLGVLTRLAGSSAGSRVTQTFLSRPFPPQTARFLPPFLTAAL